MSHTAAKLGDDDGVPQALRPKLKPLITDCGMTPKKALNRFTSQELRDAGVPEGGRPELLKKVQRWKRALAVKGKGVRALSSFADLQEWVDSNLLPAPQNMDDDVEVDKLFVLRNGVQAEAEAVAFSTIELLRTVQYVQLSGLPLHFMTDGTHKVSFNRWVLLTVGTTTIRPPTNSHVDLVNSFIPIAFCFARTESEGAFCTLFKAVVDSCEELFGQRPSPHAVVSDRGVGVRAAIPAVFPSAKVCHTILEGLRSIAVCFKCMPKTTPCGGAQQSRASRIQVTSRLLCFLMPRGLQRCPRRRE